MYNSLAAGTKDYVLLLEFTASDFPNDYLIRNADMIDTTSSNAYVETIEIDCICHVSGAPINAECYRRVLNNNNANEAQRINDNPFIVIYADASNGDALKCFIPEFFTPSSISSPTIKAHY